jgi:hypothetical protein
MAEESVMPPDPLTSHITSVGAGAAMTMPLWIEVANPYVQFTVAILGVVWLGVQIYYKIKSETKKKNDVSRPDQTD